MKKMKKKKKDPCTGKGMGEVKMILGDMNRNIQMMKEEMEKRKILYEGMEKLKVDLEESKKENEIKVEIEKMRELGKIVNSLKEEVKEIKKENMCIIN